jgi:hypothetical protein
VPRIARLEPHSQSAELGPARSRSGHSPVYRFGGWARPGIFDQGGKRMLLLIVLALIIALFIGLGFVLKWLFIIAVIAALVWLITFFTRARA